MAHLDFSNSVTQKYHKESNMATLFWIEMEGLSEMGMESVNIKGVIKRKNKFQKLKRGRLCPLKYLLSL